MTFTDAVGESVSFTYDANDNIVTATDGNGDVRQSNDRPPR